MRIFFLIICMLFLSLAKAQEYPLMQGSYEYDDCVFYKIAIMDANNTPGNVDDDFLIGRGTLTDCLDTSHSYDQEDSVRLVILKVKYFDDAGSIAYKVGLYSGDGESFLSGFISDHARREDPLEGQ